MAERPAPDGKIPRIAIVVPHFPSLSETFVLDHIVGMLDLGLDIGIIASPPADAGPFHPEVRARRLLSRTTYRGRFAVRTSSRATMSVLRSAHAVKRLLRKAGARSDRSAVDDEFEKELSAYRRAGPAALYHCHFGSQGVAAAIVLQALGSSARLVTTFHGFDMSGIIAQRGDAFYQPLFERGDLFLPVSRYWRNRLLSLGAAEERTVVHHMGVRCNQIPFVPRVFDRSHPTRIVSIGRLVEKKGFEYGIRAAAKAIDDGAEIHYQIIGDGPLAADLRALVRELRLERHVELLGARDREHVRGTLQSCDALLAPSVTASNGDQEGIPVVLMEAMASGCPVISSEHSGIPELVRHEETGWLSPERDIDGLAGHVMLVRSDAAATARLGRSARQLVEQEFNVDIQNQRLAELYHQVLQR